MMKAQSEGAVNFHASVRINIHEFSGWEPDRIASLLNGIAQVLTARGKSESTAIIKNDANATPPAAVDEE